MEVKDGDTGCIGTAAVSTALYRVHRLQHTVSTALYPVHRLPLPSLISLFPLILRLLSLLVWISLDQNCIKASCTTYVLQRQPISCPPGDIQIMNLFSTICNFSSPLRLNQRTKQPTSRHRLLATLTVPHLVKTSPAYYTIQMFITVLTTAHNFSVSKATSS